MYCKHFWNCLYQVVVFHVQNGGCITRYVQRIIKIGRWQHYNNTWCDLLWPIHKIVGSPRERCNRYKDDYDFYYNYYYYPFTCVSSFILRFWRSNVKITLFLSSHFMWKRVSHHFLRKEFLSSHKKLSIIYKKSNSFQNFVKSHMIIVSLWMHFRMMYRYTLLY